jgi:hypothetical protein
MMIGRMKMGIAPAKAAFFGHYGLLKGASRLAAQCDKDASVTLRSRGSPGRMSATGNEVATPGSFGQPRFPKALHQQLRV